SATPTRRRSSRGGPTRKRISWSRRRSFPRRLTTRSRIRSSPSSRPRNSPAPLFLFLRAALFGGLRPRRSRCSRGQPALTRPILLARRQILVLGAEPAPLGATARLSAARHRTVDRAPLAPADDDSTGARAHRAAPRAADHAGNLLGDVVPNGLRDGVCG